MVMFLNFIALSFGLLSALWIEFQALSVPWISKESILYGKREKMRERKHPLWKQRENERKKEKNGRLLFTQNLVVGCVRRC